MCSFYHQFCLCFVNYHTQYVRDINNLIYKICAGEKSASYKNALRNQLTTFKNYRKTVPHQLPLLAVLF